MKIQTIAFAAFLIAATGGSAFAQHLTPETTDIRYCDHWVNPSGEVGAAASEVSRIYSASIPYESWQMDYAEGTLVIRWNKWMAPCDLSDFSSSVDIDGNTIRINGEVTAEGGVNCVCDYDFSAHYKVSPGTYTLILDGIDRGLITLAAGASLNISTAGVSATVITVALFSISDTMVLTNTASTDINIEVISADGIRLFTDTVKAEDTVSLSSLPAGVYIIKASDGSQHSTLTFRK